VAVTTALDTIGACRRHGPSADEFKNGRPHSGATTKCSPAPYAMMAASQNGDSLPYHRGHTGTKANRQSTSNVTAFYLPQLDDPFIYPSWMIAKSSRPVSTRLSHPLRTRSMGCGEGGLMSNTNNQSPPGIATR
jgi:hypothetical protein